MDFGEIDNEVGTWMDLAQDRVSRQIWMLAVIVILG
jgi:hypothetical protein